MFVIDKRGKARQIRTLEDLNAIDRDPTRLIDDTGQILARSICKDDVRKKLFGR